MSNSVKSSIIALATLAALGGSVSAADLPSKKAPLVAPVVAAPVFTWAGAYVGAHLGHMWGRTRVDDSGTITETGARTNGFLGGGLAGYNFQSGAFVYGLEGDFSFGRVRGHGTSIPLPPTPVVPNDYTLNWAGNIRGRLGYAITPTTLPFIAGGVAITDLRFTDNNAKVILETGKTRVGWTLGAGVDQAFTNNLVGRVEYVYADYGQVIYDYGGGDYYKLRFKSQILRAALIWKF